MSVTDPHTIPAGQNWSQPQWDSLYDAVDLQLRWQIGQLAPTFHHVAGPQANALARQIQGLPSPNPGIAPCPAVSADHLCAAAFSYPVAIELARQINAGAGEIGALLGMGFSASDAKAFADGIAARGAGARA